MLHSLAGRLHWHKAHPAYRSPLDRSVSLLLDHDQFLAPHRPYGSHQAATSGQLSDQRLGDIRPLMQPQSVREFSTAVSDIVRSYIELRFGVTATHRTTEEVLHNL